MTHSLSPRPPTFRVRHTAVEVQAGTAGLSGSSLA
jgi:hypothetical protein